MTRPLLHRKPIVILSGPTASGKTALSLEIARQVDAVIINADSKQVFKEIPILTAQPTAEEKGDIPHRLFGCISVAEEMSVARWMEMAREEIDKAHDLGKVPMLVGGTGMYIKSLVYGLSTTPEIPPELREEIRGVVETEGSEALHQKLLKADPDIANKLKPGDSQRVARAYEVITATGQSLLWWQQQPKTTYYESEQFIHYFLSPDRQKVYDNCNKRFDGMVDAGVLKEAESVLAMGLDEALPGVRSHGLPELLQYLRGDISLEQAIEWAKRNTRHYIKRQFTWFRSQMPEADAILPGEDTEFVENTTKKIQNRLELTR